MRWVTASTVALSAGMSMCGVLSAVGFIAQVPRAGD
jgi:hypothetical protein